jgi:hypothetical protein
MCPCSLPWCHYNGSLTYTTLPVLLCCHCLYYFVVLVTQIETWWIIFPALLTNSFLILWNTQTKYWRWTVVSHTQFPFLPHSDREYERLGDMAANKGHKNKILGVVSKFLIKSCFSSCFKNSWLRDTYWRYVTVVIARSVWHLNVRALYLDRVRCHETRFFFPRT